MRLLPCLLLPLLLLVWPVAPVRAAEVSMAFTEQRPPYTLPAGAGGIEVDVAREALAWRGHTLMPYYFALERLPLAFRYGRVDALMMDGGQDLSDAGGHYADPAVVYEDVLISLRARQLPLHKPEDLAGLLVIGYVGARQRYPEWLALPDQQGLYFERRDQQWQALGLLRGQFDVILSDRYIFRYHANRLVQDRGLVLEPVREYRFIAPDARHYRPVFRDRKLRDDFNAGMHELRRSGRLEAIYRFYLQMPADQPLSLPLVSSPPSP